MDQNVIQNVADHYVSEYGLMDCLSDLKELIKNHGVEPFYIFRYILLVKNYLILSKKISYIAEIPSRREYLLLEDLKKQLFIKVKNRRVVEQPLESQYLNEIYLTIAVYK